MAVYSISYDLNIPGQDYSGLIQAIKDTGAWWHYLKSTWLVDTHLDASGIFNKIKPHIDNSDRILIIKVTRDYNGWLSQEAWDWIKQHL